MGLPGAKKKEYRKVRRSFRFCPDIVDFFEQEDFKDENLTTQIEKLLAEKYKIPFKKRPKDKEKLGLKY